MGVTMLGGDQMTTTPNVPPQPQPDPNQEPLDVPDEETPQPKRPR